MKVKTDKKFDMDFIEHGNDRIEEAKRIEFPDVKSFIELYREHRHEGILVQDIKIGKDERFKVFSNKQMVNFEEFHRQSATHKILIDFMLAIQEFQNDVFHIQTKSHIIIDELPEMTFTELQKLPDSFFEHGRTLRLSLRLYVFSSLRFK